MAVSIGEVAENIYHDRASHQGDKQHHSMDEESDMIPPLGSVRVEWNVEEEADSYSLTSSQENSMVEVHANIRIVIKPDDEDEEHEEWRLARHVELYLRLVSRDEVFWRVHELLNLVKFVDWPTRWQSVKIDGSLDALRIYRHLLGWLIVRPDSRPVILSGSYQHLVQIVLIDSEWWKGV